MNSDVIGLTSRELFVLLFLGLGPVRIVLAWMNIAPDLTPLERRRVAWRVTWVGMVMVAGIMFLGFFTFRNIAPQKEFLAIGAAVVVIVSSLFHRTPQPEDSNEPHFRRAMRMAIYPLAAPIMINPAGLAILIIVAIYVEKPIPYLSFFGSVGIIFGINFGLMLLLGRIQRHLSAGVTLLIGEIFAILMVSLGVTIILQNLSKLGVIMLTGT